jgi:hypothetical protein
VVALMLGCGAGSGHAHPPLTADTQKRQRPGRRSDRASVSEEVRSQSSFGW